MEALLSFVTIASEQKSQTLLCVLCADLHTETYKVFPPQIFINFSSVHGLVNDP